MSRTYRRTKKTDLERKEFYCQCSFYGYLSKNCKEYKAREREYHSDRTNISGMVETKVAKIKAKEILRTHTKNQLAKLKFLNDYEDFEFDTSKDKELHNQIFICN